MIGIKQSTEEELRAGGSTKTNAPGFKDIFFNDILLTVSLKCYLVSVLDL